MLIVHPVHLPKTIRGSATGALLRPVTCENCACEYFYRLARRITESQAAGGEIDRRNLERRIKRTLKKAINPVPCPDCGYLQRGMVRAIKGERAALLVLIALPVFAVAAGLIAVGSGPEFAALLPPGIVLALVMAAVAAGLGLAEFLKDYNTRERMEARLKSPRKTALRRGDFAELPKDFFSPAAKLGG